MHNNIYKFKIEGSVPLFVALCDSQGKVTPFPETIAKDILQNVATIDSLVPEQGGANSLKNKSVAETIQGTTKWWFRGYRALTEDETLAWLEAGTPMYLPELATSTEALEDEIERLKKQIASMESRKKINPKKADAQPEIPNLTEEPQPEMEVQP